MNVITIATGSYYYGFAALANSLAACGFTGKVIVCTPSNDARPKLNINSAAAIKFVELAPSQVWIGNWKPKLLREFGSAGSLYIDSDCIVSAPEFLSLSARMIAQKPFLCVEGIVPASDHRRLLWSGRLRAGGVESFSPLRSEYFNSGMLGLDVERDIRLLDAWRDAILLLRGGGGMYQDPAFVMPDQDCLNAVLQDGKTDFATIGPPDVWYAASPINPFLHVGVGPDPLLLHCTGKAKPWILTDVPPRSPNIYESTWYRYAYLETPWVRVDNCLPRGVKEWLAATRLGRIAGTISRIQRRIRSQG